MTHKENLETQSANHRILVISHAHPDFSLGGGEIAAYSLFQAYRKNPTVQAAWFLGRSSLGSTPIGTITLRRTDEYLWEQQTEDHFLHTSGSTNSLLGNFQELLQTLRPTVIHAHHFFNLGLEFIRIAKQVCPNVKIILTLHEYLAICHNNGQMIKRPNMALCYRATDEDCHICFPEHSADDFWLRKRFIQSFFNHIDHFVSPSRFLRDRYIAWGIPADQITVIENGQADYQPINARQGQENHIPNRFGFFGQVNEYKGVDLLLQALHQLPKKLQKSIVVEIHGANLEKQSDQFRASIQRLAKPLLKRGTLRWVGPYDPRDIRQRMAKIDWVVVPSIWWENSPMVIQEAFTSGRPVIAANIGGMVEKVQDGINGLVFEARNPLDLSDTLLKAASTPHLWDSLREGIEAPLSHADCAEHHINLIFQLPSHKKQIKSITEIIPLTT